jgi:ring-1,2-phenylacetyl-CoA epoxidase subunit PaaD
MRYNTEESKENTEAKKKAQPQCPFCGSTNTEPFALFGQQLLTVQMYCNTCHTPFEYVKDDDILEDFAARKDHQA